MCPSTFSYIAGASQHFIFIDVARLFPMHPDSFSRLLPALQPKLVLFRAEL
jgi:hypothetical protein